MAPSDLALDRGAVFAADNMFGGSVGVDKGKTMTKKKKYTRYCEHHIICDKDYDCINGELCPFFEHTGDFTSLRYEEDKHAERGYERV